MLRRSHTAVLEKNETYTSNFETEPYEVGWASEAMWFVRITETSGSNVKLRAYGQISPDGLYWSDKSDQAMEMDDCGQAYLSLRDFGSWLRLRVEIEGDKPSVKLMIVLALKE
ncbi:MAG: hypothetical protein CMJ20_04080 [Phycisphaeraceae bacterium]|nr:hypothetical protein [Phycisphaeraceae bacterium]|tara:strand:- start:3091 stop:3429 length:339 start_codon:yes stop_codon:yes gene_type:complete